MRLRVSLAAPPPPRPLSAFPTPRPPAPAPATRARPPTCPQAARCVSRCSSRWPTSSTTWTTACAPSPVSAGHHSWRAVGQDGRGELGQACTGGVSCKSALLEGSHRQAAGPCFPAPPTAVAVPFHSLASPSTLYALTPCPPRLPSPQSSSPTCPPSSTASATPRATSCTPSSRRSSPRAAPRASRRTTCCRWDSEGEAGVGVRWSGCVRGKGERSAVGAGAAGTHAGPRLPRPPRPPTSPSRCASPLNGLFLTPALRGPKLR